MASGEWRVASGEWRMANGEWRMASGEWRTASGMASGEWDAGGDEVKLSTNDEVPSTVGARLFASGMSASIVLGFARPTSRLQEKPASASLGHQ